MGRCPHGHVWRVWRELDGLGHVHLDLQTYLKPRSTLYASPTEPQLYNKRIYIYIYSIRVHLAYGHLELDVREDGVLGHDRKRFAQQCQAVKDRRLRQLYWEGSNELCVY